MRPDLAIFATLATFYVHKGPKFRPKLGDLKKLMLWFEVPTNSVQFHQFCNDWAIFLLREHPVTLIIAEAGFESFSVNFIYFNYIWPKFGDLIKILE